MHLVDFGFGVFAGFFQPDFGYGFQTFIIHNHFSAFFVVCYKWQSCVTKNVQLQSMNGQTIRILAVYKFAFIKINQQLNKHVLLIFFSVISLLCDVFYSVLRCKHSVLSIQ
jgi:hypothetical protein